MYGSNLNSMGVISIYGIKLVLSPDWRSDSVCHFTVGLVLRLK